MSKTPLPAPSLAEQGIADPTTEAFWQACFERKLLIQKCASCGHHQFYPRPFCLACESDDVSWIESSGSGTVYSVTTVRVPVTDELPPPYLLALVDLDEGVRLLSNVEGSELRIGERVSLAWRERPKLPPLPVFLRVA